jgi:hypothetical protein
MIPREPKKSRLPWTDLAVFSGVIVFLAVSLHSLFAVREAPRTAVLPKPLDAALNARAPASQTPPSTATTEVLRLPCLADGPHAANSSARLMQIHSPLCSGSSKAGATWHATNESSGEEILVFVNRHDNSLSTSYFNLKEGANHLVFTEDLGKGHHERRAVEVTRKAD